MSALDRAPAYHRQENNSIALELKADPTNQDRLMLVLEAGHLTIRFRLPEERAFALADAATRWYAGNLPIDEHWATRVNPEYMFYEPDVGWIMHSTGLGVASDEDVSTDITTTTANGESE